MNDETNRERSLADMARFGRILSQSSPGGGEEGALPADETTGVDVRASRAER